MIDHTNFSEDIFLAPEVEMTEETLDSASHLTQSLMVAVHNGRFSRGPMNPHESVALAYAYLSLLENTFDGFRRILTESLESSPVISDHLVRLYSTISAYNSICSQMYMVYLNIWDISEGIFDDASLSESLADAADKVVEQNKKDVRTWLEEEALERGIPLPPIQLSLDLQV